MNDLRTAAQQALERVQEFKRRWLLVPAFGNKVNKATRGAITSAHSPIFDLEYALRAALAQQAEPPPPLWPPTGLEPRGCPLPGACSCPSKSARSTHSEECWQWHQACAVAAVIRLRAEVARLSKRDGE